MSHGWLPAGLGPGGAGGGGAAQRPTVRQSPLALCTSVPVITASLVWPAVLGPMPISNCAAGAEQFESSPRCPCGVRESQVIVLSEHMSVAMVDRFIGFLTCLSLVFQVPSLPGGIPKHMGVSGCIEASVLPRTCGHSAVSL